MLPIDSRSSLAARREKICSSPWCTSASGMEEVLGHCSSSAALTGGVGGLPACASAAASRAESASWIAESAASVGSLIFFGVFAMSVVASYYAGLEQRQERDPDRATSALALRSLRNPLGRSPMRAAQTLSLPLGYPIGLAYRRKPLVKTSLIIVNGRRPMGR